MSRRAVGVLVTAALALSLTLLMAGCGITGSRRPVVVGDAPRLGLRAEVPDASPPRPDDAHNAQELVELYLQAAAWANLGTTDPPQARSAVERAQGFLTETARAAWQPGPTVQVVAVHLENPVQADGKLKVLATLRTVGVLTETGSVTTTGDSKPSPYVFEVQQLLGGGFRLTNPPAGLLLSTAGLVRLYETHPVYFWDHSDGKLVPDLRYLPRSVDQAKLPNTIVNWLLAGPAEWLDPAVQRVPNGIELADSVTVTPDGQKVVVNLSARAASLQDRLAHLLIQVRWSLRPTTLPVELQIAGQRQTGQLDVSSSSDQYLSANPAVPPAGAAEPDRYCVSGRQVRAAEARSGKTPVVLLGSGSNNDVVSAAIYSRTPAVALVTTRPDGRLGLSLGSSDRNRLGTAHFAPVDLVASTMSRPVWLSDPSPRVLVAADGGLYQAYAGAAGTREPITLPGIEAVTAVAVAPDNRRLALIADGQLYVAALRVSDTVAVGSLRRLDSGLASLAGVAWSQENRVVVAGRSAGVTSLVEVGVDGVTVADIKLNGLQSTPISRIVGIPHDPSRGADGSVPGLLMVEALNPSPGSYKVGSTQLFPVHADGEPDTPCTAPFFVD
jgi:hypothetical protein